MENLSDCDDTNLMVKALNSNDRDFNVGAAGTTMRFLTAFLSKVVGEWTITGTERMKNRPIKVLVDALKRFRRPDRVHGEGGLSSFAYFRKSPCKAERSRYREMLALNIYPLS